MSRLTITLSEPRYRALKEASAQRGKPIGTLIEESLEFYGIKSREEARDLVLRARQRSSLSEADEKLLNALYAVRKRLAGKQNLPAFMVFNDATLREMAEKKPMSIDELLNISGVGEKKAARYGNAFLRVIEDAVGSRE